MGAGSARAEAFRPSTLVLDFDGTLTDADAHAPEYHVASEQELARRLSWDAAKARREWQRALASVLALPPEASWRVDGYGVCPARADPYLIANGVSRLLLEERRPALERSVIAAGVVDIHRDAYRRVPPPFRPDARDALERLCAGDWTITVVTNSQTEPVERLLDSLSLRDRDRLIVRGEANKFAVCASETGDARFASLPESVDWPEVGRPVWLHRGRYFDALRRIWDAAGTGPESTLVVGDLFEMDLAMPALLGAHVHLVTRASTLVHEQRLAVRLPRSGSGPRLLDLLDRLGV